ncbi:MAG: hypothetical protein Q4B68_07175 [Bacteroidales bacterium]|nr:hypothetical protein [Bacteroidales bacterium]
MGKLTDFFTMTRRERVGALVALIVLALSIAVSYAWRHFGQSQPAEHVPSAQQMNRILDSVENRALKDTADTAVHKASSRKRHGAKKEQQRHDEKRQRKDQQPHRSAPPASEKPRKERYMDEIPSF